ncbi:MAG: HAD family hydrolase [Candidatus Hodarchaeota archaeon]
MKLEDILEESSIKGIIFDLDGTLTHTLNEHVEAFYQVFTRNGFNVDRKKIENEMGRRPTDITRDLIFNGVPDSKLNEDATKQLYRMAEEKVKTFNSLIPENPPLMPGLPGIIIRAKELGMKIAVCSSTPLENVKVILERIHLLEYFDQLVTAEDVIIGKPHPEAFLKAVEKLALPFDAVIVIGDSIHDVASAKEGGLKIIAIATGKHSTNDLKESGADFVFKNLSMML